MNSRTNRILVCAVLVAAVAASAQSARANLLVDPGYEVNALTSASNVLNNFAGFQGIWGAEVGAIVGAENGVTPPEGVQMLRMDDDGLVATQTFQVTDVTAYAGLIDSGNAVVGLSALFNVDAHVPAAVGGVTVLFFSAANFGSQIGSPITANLNTLDALPSTWESASAGGPVPIGTRWLVSQVAYGNASLIGDDGVIHPGYVDIADLRLLPEPATIGLVVVAATALIRRRR